jgi:hypothetical protein
MALSTTLVWLSWLLIGLAYPLYNVFLPTYLAHGRVLRLGRLAAPTNQILGLLDERFVHMPQAAR